MKVLHLIEPGEAPRRIDLHPRITVLRDLDRSRRDWLLGVLASLGSGRDPQATGEIEAHGVRFDLDGASLSLLGLEAARAQVVVTAEDLPGHDPALTRAAAVRTSSSRLRDRRYRELETARAALMAHVLERDQSVVGRDEVIKGEGPARQAIAAATAEATRLEQDLATARRELAAAERRLSDALDERATATAERSRLRTRFDAAQNRRRVSVANRTQAAEALNAARTRREQAGDPSADADVAAKRLEAAERAVAEVDPAQEASPLSSYLTALERRRVELARMEAATGDAAAGQVGASLATLTSASSEGAPVVAALALADSWRDLHQQISALEAGVSAEERSAEAIVASARHGVIEAEADFNQPVLTPEQISKVEAARTAVLESQDRAESRFAGGRAKRRLEELRADERRVLERLGFSTYADYMMSSSNRGAAHPNRSILDAARANLAAAETELAALPGATDRARRRVELLQRRDAIAPRVAELLGHEPTGPEAEEELRHMREAVPADALALEALVATLADAGVDIGPGPHDRDDVVLLSQAYVAEEEAAAAERGEISEAIALIDAAISTVRSARDRSEAEVPDGLGLAGLAQPVSAEPDEAEQSARTLRESRWAEVQAARSAAAEADAALTHHRAAEVEVAELESALSAAQMTEGSAEVEATAAESELGAGVEDQVSAAAEAVAEAEQLLDHARSAEAEIATRIEARQGTNGAEALVAEAEERLARAEERLAAAAAAEQTAATTFSEADADLSRAIDAELDAQATAERVDRDALAAEVEWKLMARLAALRSVGPGGSVPLVLDDPFSALDDDGVDRVLDRLAPVAGTVQIVILGGRKAVEAWADSADSDLVGVCAVG